MRVASDDSMPGRRTVLRLLLLFLAAVAVNVTVLFYIGGLKRPSFYLKRINRLLSSRHSAGVERGERKVHTKDPATVTTDIQTH